MTSYRYFFVMVFLFLSLNLSASHIVGGEMNYKYLGPGSIANSKHYQITLKLFRDNDCQNCALMPTVVSIGIFNNDNKQEFPSKDSIDVPVQSVSQVPVNAFPPCLVNPPDLNYSVGIYTYEIDLPDNENGYSATYQTCCRVTPLVNVQNNISPSGGTGGTGSTYSCTIPGNNILKGRLNTSARFKDNVSVICQNKPFTLDFSATDSDNDTLIYSFFPAYNGGAAQSAQNINPAGPPYQQVQYINGYDFPSPLGMNTTIDSRTGIISGIAPMQGKYVVCVMVSEIRNGVFIGSVYKDFIVNVAPCDFAGAQLNPKTVTCDGFTVNFSNDNQSPLNQTFFWDFGDPKSGTNDTSNQASPTHTFSDTGVYKYKLVVNKGQPCADSATQIIKVYPGFLGGYVISSHCTNVSIQFTDTTKSKYGIVDTWRWEFGDNSNPGDTSHLQNPTYTFASPGTYNIKFRVTNSKGCMINLSTPLTIINNPVVSAKFKDTLYCGNDSLKLFVTSDVPANFSWTPLTNIINANTATPTVFPKVATQYIVTADAGGCFGKDSVTVRPVTNFTTSSPPFANICEEDTISIQASSNYGPVKYIWTPGYNIQNADSSIAKVFPKVDTSYLVTGSWGRKCVSSSLVKVKVKPLAKPVAGPDQAFCSGSSGVQLNASGGDNYTWSPTLGLNNSNIPNPFATPSQTTTYVVSVGVTGCNKRRSDSLVVLVRPHPMFTKTNDTLMCSNDTLQLNAFSPTGGTFLWTPNYNIINAGSPAPQIYPKITTRYYVTLTDPFGCVNSDSVLVNVKQFVTIDAGPDTSICRTDQIMLNPTSDALHYKWSPALPLNSDTAKYPLAKPLTTTLFRVIANIGKCQSSDSVLIKVAPYPVADAGPDASICYGDSAHLHASGGSSYLWRPAFFLDNPNIADPIAFPTKNSRYVVRVSDTLGCPKATFDTVFVAVAPKIMADAGPSDTSIVAFQPLHLFGTGGVNYLWSPATGLNDPNIPDPVATLSTSVTYLLKVSDQLGCFAFDSIRVHVYSVQPGLYVPNAFTPNSNGRNDIFRPIAIGMKQINYFRIFNRWGQLMFSTTEINKGWDGTYNGKPQDAAVYVWIVQGVDYNDKITTLKGTVTLIR